MVIISRSDRGNLVEQLLSQTFFYQFQPPSGVTIYITDISEIIIIFLNDETFSIFESV